MSFIEQATLRVVDQASGPIKKIENALQSLMKQANAFGSRPINIAVRAGDLAGVESRLGRIEGLMRRAFNAPSTNVGSALASQLNQATTAANNATAAINRMHAAASRQPRAPANNGLFGRFPENIPGLAARSAGWTAVGAGHSIVRSGGHGIVDAASERTALNMTGVAIPPELIRGKGEAEAAAISRAYEATVKNAIRKGAGATASKYLTLTEAGMMDVGRTAIPNMKNPALVGKMMNTFGETASALTLVYKDAEKGMEGARQGYRALDQMGVASDPSKIDSYMKAWATGIFASGRDVSAHQMANTVSRLGGAKMGLSEDALARIIMLQDEARGQTANMVRTFQNDMVRPDKSDKMLDRAVAAGVRDKKGHVLFATELQADPQMYVLDRIKPIAERFGYVSQKMDAATGKMVEMSDAEKAAQLNKILTDKMGFSSSAKTFVLDTLVKEDEIRRNARTIDAQRGKLTPEALRNLIWSDPKSAMTAVQSQWKRAADSLTLAAQPFATGGMALAASALSGVANSPTGAAAVAAGVGVAGYYAVQHAGQIALLAAARSHFGAAGSLTTAAGALTRAALALSRRGMLPGAVMTGASKADALRKAAGLGFPVAAGAAAGGGLLSRYGITGNRLMMGLGAAAVGYDLMAGNIGNAVLGAGMLALGGKAALIGMAAVIADQIATGGKYTGAVTAGIDKVVRELFGMKPAAAADRAAALAGGVNDPQTLKIAEMAADLNREKLALAIGAERAALAKRQEALDAEVAVYKARIYNARVVGSGDFGLGMRRQNDYDPANRPNLTGPIEAPQSSEAVQARRVHEEIIQRLDAADRLSRAVVDAMQKRAEPTPDMGDWFPPPPPPSFWDRLWEFIIPKAAAADRPPMPDFIPYGGEPGLGLAGGVGGAGAGVGASLFDPLSAPLTTAGETAASSISAGGAEAGAAIGASGAEFVGAASSAGSVLLDYASQAGQALLSAASSVQFPVPSAASVPQRSQNTGANPVAR